MALQALGRPQLSAAASAALDRDLLDMGEADEDEDDSSHAVQPHSLQRARIGDDDSDGTPSENSDEDEESGEDYVADDVAVDTTGERRRRPRARAMDDDDEDDGDEDAGDQDLNSGTRKRRRGLE